MISVVPGRNRLVVGASGSPRSLPALRYAHDLARCNAVPLVVVHAWVPPGGDLAERRAPSAQLRRIWTDAAWQRLQDALDTAWGADDPDLDVEPVVIRGEAGPALVDLANTGADLLVIGAGRRGRMARMRHGKVSRYCLEHARCPVLAVPPAATREPGLGMARWSRRQREQTLDRALRDWTRQQSPQRPG